MTIKISIALCTFEGERFLPLQLGSIAAQTRLPDELVICDDASSDGTANLIEKFATHAPFPVHLRRNPSRLGSNRNFEQAISLCSGDLVFLADQDDVWASSKIEAMTQRFERDEQLACLFTNARRIDGEGRNLPRTLWQQIHFTPRMRQRVHHGHAFRVLAADNYATGATMAFRSRWRDAILPIPVAGIVHDDWIALVLSAVARVDCDERALIDYREHEAQQIGSGEPAGGMKRWVTTARQTGGSDYAARAVRLELALERLRKIDASLPAVRDLQQRVLHLRARASLPASRLARFSVVAGELPRYFRYSNHFWSIAKDLLD